MWLKNNPIFGLIFVAIRPFSVFGASAATIAGIGAGIGGAASLAGGLIASNSANNAADLQNSMWQTAQQNFQPYLQNGQTSLSSIMKGLNGGVTKGQFTHQFNANDLNANLAPNYAWQLGQGEQALNNSNSVTGGLVGGNALTALNNYAQNQASGAYQQAYENYNTNQNNIYGRLSNIAGLGQSSAANAANAGAQYAGQIGSNIVNSGNALSAGISGVGNSASNLGSSFLLSSLLNKQPKTQG